MPKQSFEIFIRVFLITVIVGGTIVFGMNVVEKDSAFFSPKTQVIKSPMGILPGEKQAYVSSSMGKTREGLRELVQDSPQKVLEQFKIKAAKAGQTIQIVRNKEDEIVAYYSDLKRHRHHIWASARKGKGTMVYRSVDGPLNTIGQDKQSASIQLPENMKRVFFLQKPEGDQTEIMLFESLDDSKTMSDDLNEHFNKLGWEFDQQMFDQTKQKVASPIYRYSKGPKECYVRLIDSPSGCSISVMLRNYLQE